MRAVALDATDPAGARSAVRTAVDQFGRLDVLVNAAGSANSALFEETSDDEFRAQLEINLFGVVNGDPGRAAGVPRAALGPADPVLVGRWPSRRITRAQWLPDRQVRRRRVQRSHQRRDETRSASK